MAHAHPRVATRRGPGGSVLLGRSKVIHSNSLIRNPENAATFLHGALGPGLHFLSAAWLLARLAPVVFFLERLISGEWLSSIFTHRVPAGAVR